MTRTIRTLTAAAALTLAGCQLPIPDPNLPDGCNIPGFCEPTGAPNPADQPTDANPGTPTDADLAAPPACGSQP